jgi:hypothetical protein
MEEPTEAERRRAEFLARVRERGKPLTKEQAEKVARLLARPRRQGAA